LNGGQRDVHDSDVHADEQEAKAADREDQVRMDQLAVAPGGARAASFAECPGNRNSVIQVEELAALFLP
jgi:hypothetical protein